MSSVHIVPLQIEHFEEFFNLICALAAYEHLDPPDRAARDRLYDDAFVRVPPRYQAMLAIADGSACGYCIYYETYSSFLAKPTLYVEDIFVLPQWRTRGIGRKMMATLAQIARQRGCGRMEWIVLDWNESAHRFYRALGAVQLPQWQLYRLDETTINRLADAQ